MPAYITIHDKKNKFTEIAPDAFENHLPLDVDIATSTKKFITSNTVTLYWGWGDTFEKDPLDSLSSVSIFDGPAYELEKEEKNLNDEKNFHELHKKISMGSSLTKITDDSIYSFVSIPGTHSLFYYKSEDLFIVSNYISLISVIVNLTIRKKAMISLSGRYHNIDFKTVYNEINQIPPGTVVAYKKKSNKLKEIKPNLDFLFNNYTLDELDLEIEKFIQKQGEIIKSFNSPLNVTLSGGKDSRAILSIIYKSKITDLISRVTTNGYQCSPEVMAAKDVLETLNLSHKHKINTPTSSLVNKPNFPRKIVKTLFARQGEGGLVDLANTPNKAIRELYIGGHENGLKTPMNNKSFDEYINNKSWWFDGAGIFKDETLEQCIADHKKNLKDTFKDIPTNSLSHIESLFLRNGTYLASALKASNVGANQYHPFLSTDLIRILLSSPEEARSSQYILYRIIASSNKGIEYIPFCSDCWPGELIKIVKTRFSEEEAHLLQNVKPYEFHEYLPDATGFGIYKWRQDLCHVAKGFIQREMSKEGSLFDFIDEKKLNKLLSKDVDKLNVMEMGSILGLLSCVMHLNFGVGLYDKTKHYAIEKIIAREFNESAFNFSSLMTQENLLLSDISRLDESLYKATLEIRKLKGSEHLNSAFPLLMDHIKVDSSYELEYINTADKELITIDFSITNDASSKSKSLILEILPTNQDNISEVIDTSQLARRADKTPFLYLDLNNSGSKKFTIPIKLIKPGPFKIRISQWEYKKPFFIKNLTIK